MRPYEIMLIMQPNLEEEAVETILTRFTDIITNGGGEIRETDTWGNRRLAYEIKGFTEGFYVVIKFTADSPTAMEFERIIKITDEVIRYLIVREVA